MRKRRLLEEHPQRLAAEHRQLIRVAARLEVYGKAQDRADLERREIADLKKIAAPQGNVGDRGEHDLYNYAEYA